MRQLAAALGTDSSSLYRHFRNKTELLLAVTDRILLTAMEGYRRDGDWRQRITTVATRLWRAFGRHPQLATIWGRYASTGSGSRLAMEETCGPYATRACPTRTSPATTTGSPPCSSHWSPPGAAANANTPEQVTQKAESFRVTVLGADPDRFPALSHFARHLRPITFHHTTFDEIIAVYLDHIQATLPVATPPRNGT